MVTWDAGHLDLSPFSELARLTLGTLSSNLNAHLWKVERASCLVGIEVWKGLEQANLIHLWRVSKEKI